MTVEKAKGTYEHIDKESLHGCGLKHWRRETGRKYNFKEQIAK